MYPHIISIGDFFIPTYGVLVGIAFLVGILVTGRLARRTGMNSEAVVNLGVYCALAGIIGAKLLLIGYDFDYYLQHPGEILSLSTFRAGGVFFGGFVAAFIVAVLYMRKTQLPVLATADTFVPGVALGHAIGRVGCFAAGCCWGAESNLPWAVTFTNTWTHQWIGTPLGVALHPTQIYESLAEAVLFVFLYRRFHRPRKQGEILGLYLAVYPTFRFLVEFIRAHEQANPFGGPLSTAQYIALPLVVLGLWLLVRHSPEAVPTR